MQNDRRLRPNANRHGSPYRPANWPDVLVALAIGLAAVEGFHFAAWWLQ